MVKSPTWEESVKSAKQRALELMRLLPAHQDAIDRALLRLYETDETGAFFPETILEWAETVERAGDRLIDLYSREEALNTPPNAWDRAFLHRLRLAKWTVRAQIALYEVRQGQDGGSFAGLFAKGMPLLEATAAISSPDRAGELLLRLLALFKGSSHPQTREKSREGELLFTFLKAVAAQCAASCPDRQRHVELYEALNVLWVRHHRTAPQPSWHDLPSIPPEKPKESLCGPQLIAWLTSEWHTDSPLLQRYALQLQTLARNTLRAIEAAESDRLPPVTSDHLQENLDWLFDALSSHGGERGIAAFWQQLFRLDVALKNLSAIQKAKTDFQSEEGFFSWLKALPLPYRIRWTRDDPLFSSETTEKEWKFFGPRSAYRLRERFGGGIPIATAAEEEWLLMEHSGSLQLKSPESGKALKLDLTIDALELSSLEEAVQRVKKWEREHLEKLLKEPFEAMSLDELRSLRLELQQRLESAPSDLHKRLENRKRALLAPLCDGLVKTIEERCGKANSPSLSERKGIVDALTPLYDELVAIFNELPDRHHELAVRRAHVALGVLQMPLWADHLERGLASNTLEGAKKVMEDWKLMEEIAEAHARSETIDWLNRAEIQINSHLDHLWRDSLEILKEEAPSHFDRLQENYQQIEYFAQSLSRGFGLQALTALQEEATATAERWLRHYREAFRRAQHPEANRLKQLLRQLALAIRIPMDTTDK